MEAATAELPAPSRVALFGLSADPPTRAHAAIVAHVASLVDELWVLPVYRHSFSSKRGLAPFEERLRMCELGLGSVARNVRVLDVERSVVEAADAAAAAAGLSSPRVGSVDVLDALRASFPNVEKWSWVLGSDAASDLCAGRWKDGDRLQSLVHLYVVERPGNNAIPGGPNATPLRLPALEGVSSTAVRRSLAEGRQADAAAMLDARVAEHIASHGLYRP